MVFLFLKLSLWPLAFTPWTAELRSVGFQNSAEKFRFTFTPFGVLRDSNCNYVCAEGNLRHSGKLLRMQRPDAAPCWLGGKIPSAFIVSLKSDLKWRIICSYSTDDFQQLETKSNKISIIFNQTLSKQSIDGKGLTNLSLIKWVFINSFWFFNVSLHISQPD